MDPNVWGTDPAFTPTQLVGLNFKRARELRGWTQTQAAEKLEPYLGALWSQATVSDVEQAGRPTPRRTREFDVEELVAFSLAFGLPIGWFFLPPDWRTATKGVVTLGHPDRLQERPVKEFLRHALAYSARTDPEYTQRIDEGLWINSERAGDIDDLADDLAEVIESLSTEVARLRQRLDQARGATS